MKIYVTTVRDDNLVLNFGFVIWNFEIVWNLVGRRDPSPLGNRETEKQKNKETKIRVCINWNIRYHSSGRQSCFGFVICSFEIVLNLEKRQGVQNYFQQHVLLLQDERYFQPELKNLSPQPSRVRFQQSQEKLCFL